MIPGTPFQSIFVKSHKKIHKENSKSRPQHAFVHALFFLLSFLSVCFPSCFLYYFGLGLSHDRQTMLIKGGACIHKNSHKSKLTLDRKFTRSKNMSMRDVRRMTTREPSLQSSICSMCFCFHSCAATACLLLTWLAHHKSHARAKCSCDSTVSLFFCSLASPQADAQRDQ